MSTKEIPTSVPAAQENSTGCRIPFHARRVGNTGGRLNSNTRLPADYSFAPADSGSHIFSVTLTTPGEQQITADDIANQFEGEADTEVSALPASQIVATGGSEQSVVGSLAFAQALQVTVMDMYGNTISNPNVTVTFTVTPNGNGASAVFPNGTITTQATAYEGTAATSLIANSIAGSYTVRAYSGELTPAIFNLTNNPIPSYVVTNTQGGTDSKPDCSSGMGSSCSLRDAIGIVNGLNSAGNIGFQSGLTGPIQLSSGLTIGSNINIQGPGANVLAINGGGSSSNFSVFTIDSGVTASISGLTIANGYVVQGPTNGGGGIFNNGRLTVGNCVLSGNQALSSKSAAGDGGGILNLDALTVSNCTFSGNSASGGGGIANEGSLTTVTNSVFTANAATASGGGIYAESPLTVTNSTFSGNTAALGGAIQNIAGLTVIQSTIAGNSVNQYGSSGGGIFTEASTPISVVNSIVSGNTASGVADDIDCNPGNTTVATFFTNQSAQGGNILGSVNAGGALVAPAINPVNIATLGNYGGPTQTMVPVPGTSNTTSAICAGLTANIPAGLTTDQRGYPRTNTTYTGYTSPNPACVDAGAVQTNYTGIQWVTQPPQPTATVTTGQPFAWSPSVEVLENNANAVNGVPVTIALDNAGSTTLGGTVTQTTSNGAASFSGLTVSADGSGYTLTTDPITIVGSDILPAAIPSNAFNAIGSATHFAVSPQLTGNATAGVPFNVTVTALDASGNNATGYTGPVELGANYSHGVALGSYPFLAGSGVQTYSITLDTAGTPTITVWDASNSSITGTSGSITVVAAAPAQIAATAGTPQSAVVGVAFAQGLQATVTDADGNPVSGVPVTFTTPSNGASAVFAGGTITVQVTTGANGIASTPALTANSTLGNYNVTATAGAGALSTNFSLTNSPVPSYVVTNTLSGTDATQDCTSGTGTTCSLLDALTLANTAGAANITFASGTGQAFATAQTIQLTISGLTVSGNISITGPTTGSGATLTNLVTVSGCDGPTYGSAPGPCNNVFPVFTVAQSSTASIANLNIDNGQAPLSAGGVYNLGNLTLTGASFSNNVNRYEGQSAVSGGAVYNAGQLHIAGSTFSQNLVGGSGNGGAIFNDLGGRLDVKGSTFWGNTGYGNGGAIDNLGTLTVTGSTFGNASMGNFTDGKGGGALANETGAEATVTYSTFVRNAAAWGAAIANNGTLTLASSTLNNNVGNNAGGGIACDFDNSSGLQNGKPCSSMTISNSIVSGNAIRSSTSLQYDDIDDGNSAGTYTGNGGNLVGFYNSQSANPPSSDAGLPSAANNGGATQTILPLVGSPAICAGLMANIPAGATTDQRGYPNNTTYPGFAGNPCVDAGAVQTNYSIAFSTQPPSNVPVGNPFSATVTLSESGAPVTTTTNAETVSVALNPATGSSSPWTIYFVDGIADGEYEFTTTQPGQNDTLIATLTLNSVLAAPATVTATSNPFDVNAGPVVRLALSGGPASATAGSPFSITVTALDARGNTASNYTGTVTFTSTDRGTQTVLPPQYTFRSGTGMDNGVHTFTNGLTLTTAGQENIGVTDAANASIIGSFETTVKPVGPATISAPYGSGQYTAIGTQFGSTLWAFVQDSYGNAVADGTTVTFSAPSTGNSASFSTVSPTTALGYAKTAVTANGIAGSYQVQAAVSGVSTPATFSLTNGQALTSMLVSASPTAPMYGQPVTLIATMNPVSQGGSQRTGTVSFYDGGTWVANAPATTTANYANAQYVVNTPSAGPHTYYAQYNGDTNFEISEMTSAPIISVAQVTPVITWATPASIAYGTALSATQLNATSSVPGTFVYSPAAGSMPAAGSDMLTVTFTPTDTVDYAGTTANVSIVVAQATPVITWATPASIEYGAALSAAQLNATASVPGTFVYSPAAGSMPAAGSDKLTVTFTPTDTVDYAGTTANVSIVVAQATPVITWATPASIAYGAALSAAQLNATSSVPGTLVYSPAAGSMPAAGSDRLTVTFTPTDTADYADATANVSIVVAQAAPVIAWATPASIAYGTALSAAQLNATASVPGTFVYSPAAGSIPAAGSDNLTVTFTPNDTTDYTSASATVTLVVTAIPVPSIGTLSPGFANQSSATFTLTVNGTGVTSNSTVYWNTSGLATQYVSPAQITAQVTVADLATTGVATITVQTPTPGGATSNSFQFEVDSASPGTTPILFTTVTATVTPGATASYPVIVPTTATSVSVKCLNLPSQATCTYSATTGVVTIATTSATPAGTYQVTVVFTETVPSSSSAFVLLPLLLLPLLFMRRKLTTRGIWISSCLALALLSGAAIATGCGGGSSSSTPKTNQVTSSGTVGLTVQ